MKLTKKQLELVENIKKRLEIANNIDDTERAHVEADLALCDLLEGLGFDDVVDKFKRIGKWYH